MSRKIEEGCFAVPKGYANAYPVRVVRSIKIGGGLIWETDGGAEYMASELRRVTEDEAQRISDQLDISALS